MANEVDQLAAGSGLDSPATLQTPLKWSINAIRDDSRHFRQ